MDERRSRNNAPVANKPAEIKMLGYEIVEKIAMLCSVSYTHLTLPTNREV